MKGQENFKVEVFLNQPIGEMIPKKDFGRLYWCKDWAEKELKGLRFEIHYNQGAKTYFKGVIEDIPHSIKWSEEEYDKDIAPTSDAPWKISQIR
jgi:hypothetical protein